MDSPRTFDTSGARPSIAATKTKHGRLPPGRQPARTSNATRQIGRTSDSNARTGLLTAVRSGAQTAALDPPTVAKASGAAGAGALEFVTFPWKTLAALDPHDVALSYWFDADDAKGTHEVSVTFTGRRMDVIGVPSPGDVFHVVGTMGGVKPGMGRVALTQRVAGANPGRWKVDAVAAATPTTSGGAVRPGAQTRLTQATATGMSIYAPVARQRAPRVILGVWPALVGLGAIAGVALQLLLARAEGLPWTHIMLLALVASLVGLAGAKVYYRLTHLSEKKGLLVTGASLQGFVIGAIAVLTLGSLLWRLPVGAVLDVTTPALLLGQAIGRVGCFFGGCCAGLPTTSKWGLWSSDRRIGIKRVPVQLMESGSALILALVSTALILLAMPTPRGLVFIGGLSAYLIVRQLLFPLRGVPRKTTHGRVITLALASATLIATGVAAFLNLLG